VVLLLLKLNIVGGTFLSHFFFPCAAGLSQLLLGFFALPAVAFCFSGGGNKYV
jgi:hypothetical protein